MGGDVTIATRSVETVRRLSQGFGGRVHVLAAQTEELKSLCRSADVVIGAALVAGGAAPKLVSTRTVKAMKPGAVIVDVSIDQGGCIETSHATTHSRPTFVVDDVVHYCVANIRAQCRERRHSRSTMRRVPSFWPSRTKGFLRH